MEAEDGVECRELCMLWYVDMNEADKGVNAAFAIGRLCDHNDGRNNLLHHKDANKMVRMGIRDVEDY